MDNLNKTTHFVDSVSQGTGSLVTIFDGQIPPRTVSLDAFGKSVVSFGRSPGHDIVLTSNMVSGDHGRFIRKGFGWAIEDKGTYQERGSTNGLIYNNASVMSHTISDGDFIRIDDGIETISEGVLFVFSSQDSANKWQSIPLSGKGKIAIGRDKDCDVHLPHVSVSKHHANIIKERDGYYITDNGSTNGVLVNNKRISGKERLHEKDVIVITNSKLIYTGSMISYCCYKSGISVDASDIVIRRSQGKKSFITSDHVTLTIKPGELVGIIGGSGAGKSTILNCMCGYLQPTQGDVFINGVNLYHNFDALKKLIGYVPQSDIVYDNLTLYDMLLYTGKLRLPKDTSKAEMEQSIMRAIELVDLLDKKDSLIKNLSGGQRKRASIAVELLSDPNLLFLDEPASGLDPGTERSLMRSLRSMANGGKTVILVTHSTLQLQMCDKIVFMGKGGKLCFYGSYQEALSFFGISDIVDVYNLLSNQSERWSSKFEKTRIKHGAVRSLTPQIRKAKETRLTQLGVLSARYLKLTMNDRRHLLTLLCQAPILAILISMVTDGNQFEQYDVTKSLLFALSCSAFWLGLYNAIQEICKERTILKREYMTGLSLSAYVASKMLVLGSAGLLQSILLTVVFSVGVGLPTEGVFLPPFLEFLISAILTTLCATAMGLCVSTLFNNPDRATTVAPFLLMPQILFSGLLFKLSGITEYISWLTTCRWSMEGFGTTSNLNKLPLLVQQNGMIVPHEAEAFFEFTSSHLICAWGMLALYVIVFLVIARMLLANISREQK